MVCKIKNTVELIERKEYPYTAVDQLDIGDVFVRKGGECYYMVTDGRDDSRKYVSLRSGNMCSMSRTTQVLRVKAGEAVQINIGDRCYKGEPS